MMSAQHPLLLAYSPTPVTLCPTMSHSVFEQGLLATDGSPKTHEGDLSSEKELLILHTSWHREAFVDGDTITAVWHAFGGEYNDDGSQTAPRQMTSLRFVAS